LHLLQVIARSDNDEAISLFILFWDWHNPTGFRKDAYGIYIRLWRIYRMINVFTSLKDWCYP